MQGNLVVLAKDAFPLAEDREIYELGRSQLVSTLSAFKAAYDLIQVKFVLYVFFSTALFL